MYLMGMEIKTLAVPENILIYASECFWGNAGTHLYQVCFHYCQGVHCHRQGWRICHRQLTQRTSLSSLLGCSLQLHLVPTPSLKCEAPSVCRSSMKNLSSGTPQETNTLLLPENVGFLGQKIDRDSCTLQRHAHFSYTGSSVAKEHFLPTTIEVRYLKQQCSIMVAHHIPQ